MILFELVGDEGDPAYQALEVANGNRQYDFLRSVVEAALAVDRPFLSQHVIKALNFQAITCLHTNPGDYRPCEVTVGSYEPPQYYRVPALMDDFVNVVNRIWEKSDPVVLGAFVLWRLNHIHPFVNGNGRTARAACYFTICLAAKGWLSGTVILPELIRRERSDYIAALRHADESAARGTVDLAPLHALLVRLLSEQLASSPPDDEAPVEPPS